MALSTDCGCEIDKDARARWMGRVLIGKPGGEPLEMGMLKYFAQRTRSRLIHLSLSMESEFYVYANKYRRLGAMCTSQTGRYGIDLLLMAIGAVFPHVFIRPPKKTGTYLISHCLNDGEFWEKRQLHPGPFMRSRTALSVVGVQTCLQKIERNVCKW